VRFLKAAHANKEMVHLSAMILDSTLITFEGLTCRYLPSQIAAGAVLLARRTVERYDWSPTLVQYSKYCEEDVRPVARVIIRAKDKMNPDLVALKKKYSKTKFGKVSEVTLASLDELSADENDEDMTE
jgi:G2/mitotic-specific cyclin-B, other